MTRDEPPSRQEQAVMTDEMRNDALAAAHTSVHSFLRIFEDHVATATTQIMPYAKAALAWIDETGITQSPPSTPSHCSDGDASEGTAFHRIPQVCSLPNEVLEENPTKECITHMLLKVVSLAEAVVEAEVQKRLNVEEELRISLERVPSAPPSPSSKKKVDLSKMLMGAMLPSASKPSK